MTDNKDCYKPEDLSDFDWEKDLGAPGAYPFTRGIYPDMYRSRKWTMRQYAGFGNADETNKRFRYLLGNGQTGLSVAFDSAHPDGPRLRRPHGVRRSWPHRRAD
jgi:methylmalonyl-CoA mutase N-terminal domain/subunit